MLKMESSLFYLAIVYFQVVATLDHGTIISRKTNKKRKKGGKKERQINCVSPIKATTDNFLLGIYIPRLFFVQPLDLTQN